MSEDYYTEDYFEDYADEIYTVQETDGFYSVIGFCVLLMFIAIFF